MAEFQTRNLSDEDRMKRVRAKMLAAKRQQRYRIRKKALCQTVGPTHPMQIDVTAKELTSVLLDDDVRLTMV